MVGTIASVGNRSTARLGSVVFLGAAVLAAASTGWLAGALGERLDFTAWAMPLKLAVLLALLVFAILHDAGRVLLPWPYVSRQVAAGTWNRRGPVQAAFLWGLQLGVGVLTHVPAKILYTLIVACLFAGTSSGALLYGVYGAIKGMQPLIATFNSQLSCDPSLETPPLAIRLQQAAQLATLLVTGTSFLVLSMV